MLVCQSKYKLCSLDNKKPFYHSSGIEQEDQSFQSVELLLKRLYLLGSYSDFPFFPILFLLCMSLDVCVLIPSYRNCRTDQVYLIIFFNGFIPKC